LSFQQIHSEEITAARDKVASVVWHSHPIIEESLSVGFAQQTAMPNNHRTKISISIISVWKIRATTNPVRYAYGVLPSGEYALQLY
jgi:hypothetical protein